ncbi:MAG: UDP-glucose 6-dehydrogenase [uncultured bacterium]|nr:MAG: UDP-glucose 6-dehydrogenase [uncultured bacterium]
MNGEQKKVLFTKIRDYYGDLKGKTLAVWGLSFKPKTDDMREAPSLTVLPLLSEAGARLRLFDPVAMENARGLLGEKGITYCDTSMETLDGADALVILTEWDEFRGVDLTAVKDRLKEPVIFDGRNIYPLEEVQEAGLTYIDIGRKRA